MELLNDAAIPGDLPHGTSEQCLGLCEGSWVSDLPQQTSAGDECDFSARFSKDCSNSFPSSLGAAVDSRSSSDLFDEFINYPLLSASPQPLTEQFHCKTCHRAFPSVNSTLQHIAASHQLAESKNWPCLEPNCGLRFASDKDLRRHLVDIHLGIKYTCSCGRRHRRDKHLSHIRDGMRKCNSLGPYICGCGAATDSDGPTAFDDHLKHLTEIFFTCSCRQRHHVTEHLRHLEYHQCMNGAPYICHCGRKTDSNTETGLEDHRHHVEDYCLHGPSYGIDGQPRKRGRPRKINSESTQRRTD